MPWLRGGELDWQGRACVQREALVRREVLAQQREEAERLTDEAVFHPVSLHSRFSQLPEDHPLNRFLRRRHGMTRVDRFDREGAIFRNAAPACETLCTDENHGDVKQVPDGDRSPRLVPGDLQLLRRACTLHRVTLPEDSGRRSLLASHATEPGATTSADAAVRIRNAAHLDHHAHDSGGME